MEEKEIIPFVSLFYYKIPNESDILRYLKFLRFKHYDNIIEVLDDILSGISKDKDCYLLNNNEIFKNYLISIIDDFKIEVKESLDFPELNLNLEKLSKSWTSQKGIVLSNLIYSIHRSMKNPNGCWKPNEIEIIFNEIETFINEIEEFSIKSTQFDYILKVMKVHLSDNLWKRLDEWQLEITHSLNKFKDSIQPLMESDIELYDFNILQYKKYSKNLYLNFDIAKNELQFFSNRIAIFNKEYEPKNANNETEKVTVEHKLISYAFLRGENKPTCKEYAEKYGLNHGSVKTYNSRFAKKELNSKTNKLQNEIRRFLIDNQEFAALEVFNKEPYLTSINSN